MKDRQRKKIARNYHLLRRVVQRRKLSPTGSDPQIGLQMIPNRK